MMNLYALKYFYDAALAENLSQAARKNRVSPSAVSQAIRQLEIHLGVKLLVHKKRDFVLTEQGQALFEKSAGLLQSILDLESQITEVPQLSVSGVIHFATQQSIATSILPKFLSALKKECPHLIPRFRLGNSTMVKKWLEDSEVDFALSLDNVRTTRLTRETVDKGYFVFVAAKGFSLPRKLAQLEFLVTGATPEVKELKKSFKQKHSQPLPVKAEIDSWSVIKKFVAEGHGIGFIPDYLIEPNEALTVFTAKDLRLPAIPYSLCILRSPSHRPNHLEEAFAKLLKRHFA